MGLSWKFAAVVSVSSAAFACGGAARAQAAAPSTGVAAAPSTPAQLEPVIIRGNYNTGVGSTDAASGGTVNSKLIENRPTLRPAEVLEFVPGVIVTQHSGDGKANQYFLRGFNLDHGTDFAIFVDGMPVNMPTHAHGHGYSDLNWLIPELVDRIAYKKGPYYADEGDFSSAGAARIRLFDGLPRGIGSVTFGENGYRRALVADSVRLGGGELLFALEGAHNDGPWVNPEKFHRSNGVLRFSSGDLANHQSITAMAYSAGWNSTDQIPQRAVDSGSIDRFGAIDPSDGGKTSRYSLSYDLQRTDTAGSLKVNAYAIRSRLDLFSDFTFALDDPVHGDQFEQAERRSVVGANASRSFNAQLAGRDSTSTVGVQLRHDRLTPVGLYATQARERLSTTQESRVRQTSIAVWADNATQWTGWLRSVAGVRADRFQFDVASSIAENSGKAHATIASPKLSLIFGPWRKTEAFVNYGWGYHSNDARGTTAGVAAKFDESGVRPPIDRVDPLVRSKGGELGLRSEIVPGLQSSLSLWRLKLDSELLFVGDAGETQATGASERSGIEFNNHWLATPWLLFDVDLAASRARFSSDQGDAPHSGRRIPGSIDKVAAIGATVTDLGPWFGQFQLRYFGGRPLIEDDSQRSKATTLAYLRVGYRLTPDLRLALDVFNLFDRRASDIDYYYASRLPGEPSQGVDDIHFHPVEPRSVRLTLSARF